MKKIKQFLREIFAPRVIKNTYYYGTNHGNDVKLNKLWEEVDGVWKQADKVWEEADKIFKDSFFK